MTEITIVNGQIGRSVDSADRGFHYGDGLFETVLVVNQQPVLLDLHMQRLQKGCHRLQIASLDLNHIQMQIESLALQCTTRAILKLIVTRGQGLGGYAPQRRRGEATVVISVTTNVPFNDDLLNGIQLFQCKYRLPNNPVLAGIKHLNRLDQVMARAEWGDEYPEGLMLNNEGEVVEGTMTNLFVEKAGKLYTPDLSRCGVDGVMRTHLIAVCPVLGIPCEVRRLSEQELKQADGIFVCNSVRGIWPVTEYAGITYAVTPITRSLQEQIAHWYS